MSLTRRALPLAVAALLTFGGLSAVTAACSCPTAAAANPAGCSSTGGAAGGVGGTHQPCSPGARQENAFGRIAVQQAGPQAPVAWGVYPTDPAGTYKVTITVDGQVYDDKPPQPYPPHGSVIVDASNKRYLQSGGTFAIDGTVTRADKTLEVFYFRCTLA